MTSRNVRKTRAVSSRLVSDTPSQHPLDALWRPSAIVWIAVTGLAISAALALAPGVSANRFIYFGLALLATQWIAGLTLGGLFLLRVHLATRSPPAVAYVAVLLLFVATSLVGTAAWLLMQGVWPSSDESWAKLLLRLLGIAAAVSVLGLGAFRNHWSARQAAVRASQAELESLQARIDPHFLFNTLNTATALVHLRPEAAEQTLLDLADLFRAALGGPRDVQLSEELELTRRYVDIESLRFSDRLQVRWQVPTPMPSVIVPILSVQPLVENAIRHGVEPSSQPSQVDIVVEHTPDTVIITVINPLARVAGAFGSGHSVGLASSKARIDALTQGRGRLETRIEDGNYVARITLPN